MAYIMLCESLEFNIHSFLDPPFSIFEWPTTHVQFFFQNDQQQDERLQRKPTFYVWFVNK